MTCENGWKSWTGGPSCLRARIKSIAGSGEPGKSNRAFALTTLVGSNLSARSIPLVRAPRGVDLDVAARKRAPIAVRKTSARSYLPLVANGEGYSADRSHRGNYGFAGERNVGAGDILGCDQGASAAGHRYSWSAVSPSGGAW